MHCLLSKAGSRFSARSAKSCRDWSLGWWPSRSLGSRATPARSAAFASRIEAISHRYGLGPSRIYFSDLRDADLPANTYDVIFARWVFLFLPDPAAHVAQLARALKPGGHLLATVPHHTSVWAWGDPSHTRIITPEQLVFLRQSSYDQVGKTSMSDFRNIYKADFETIFSEEDPESFMFILKAIK